MKKMFCASIFFSILSAATTDITLYQDPNCGCCEGWAESMRKNGFTLQQTKNAHAMMAIKKQYDIRNEQMSCHTAIVGDYIIEGHVPPAEVQRLLAEEPTDAIGIAVPGMPLGSYGMDYDSREDVYDVLLLKKDGTTEVYRHYKGKNALNKF